MADLESLLNKSPSSMMVSDDLIQPNLVNASMQECLARANSERRLVAGFKGVIDCLESGHPEDRVLFCILPENLWSDKDRRALFKFVIALCFSHDVKMIKVDDDQLVRKIIDRTSGASSQGHLSYECMLVLQPSHSSGLLQCDQHLLSFHHRFQSNDFDHLPLVKLSEY